MRSTVIVLAGALLCSSIAFATPPRALSNAALDKVAAGAGLADPFIDAFVNGLATSSTTPASSTDPTTQNPATTTGAGNQAVTGSSNTSAGAVADNTSDAINGKDNTQVKVDQSGGIAADGSVAGSDNQAKIQNGDGTNLMTGDITLSISDAFKNYETTNSIGVSGNGNATFVGDNNTVNNTTENSTVTGTITGSGVVAHTATVSDSFNTCNTTNNVAVTITGSFNTLTNTLDISGQGTVSGIINAQTLGFQAIGNNMNITTATSNVPNNVNVPTASIGLAGYGAAAVTSLTQTNVVASIGVIVGDISVPVSVGTTPAVSLGK